MAVMDEFKEERAKMKDASPKEKLHYFWDYYKWHTIVGALVLIFLTAFIYDIATKKDTVLQVAIINHYAAEAEAAAYMESLSSYLAIDTKKEEVYLDSTYSIDFDNYDQQTMASSEKLMAMTAAGSLDVIIAGEDFFEQYASNDFFVDLRELLDTETLKKYESRLYYIETENGKVPVGLTLDDCENFYQVYFPLKQTSTKLGVVANNTHPETVVKFLSFLFGDASLN